MATTRIESFRQDPRGDWIVELACGHTQHVRHRPPWQNRAWTQTAEGRSAHLGTEIECPICDLPDGNGRRR
jgi:hypothetical protein